MGYLKQNVIREKRFGFALRIIKLYKYLTSEQREFILAKQVLRSGTAIGAMQRESEHAESRSDFIHKLAIAQKECNETIYWLELLYRSEYMSEDAYQSIDGDAKELIKLITSIIKTTKKAN